jgi:phage shock protein A
MEDTFQTIRNYSGLSVEQRAHQDIRRNEAQVTSLRAEVEQSHLNYQALEKKYREAVSKDEKLDLV